MGRSHSHQPLRRFAPPPHKWGGAISASPSGASRHLPMNGEEHAFTPLSLTLSPVGRGESRLGQPLRRLRRHLPMNGEEHSFTPLSLTLSPVGRGNCLSRTRLPVPPAPRSLSIALLVG